MNAREYFLNSLFEKYRVALNSPVIKPTDDQMMKDIGPCSDDWIQMIKVSTK